jgi:hypothetical protein
MVAGNRRVTARGEAGGNHSEGEGS